MPVEQGAIDAIAESDRLVLGASVLGVPSVPATGSEFPGKRPQRLTPVTRVGFVGISIVALSVLVSRPDQLSAWIAGAFGVLLALTFLWLSLHLERRRTVPMWLVRAVGLLMVGLVFAVIVFCGIFSPTVVGLFMTVIYWGLSDRIVEGRLVYATSAIGYFGLGLLAVFGVIDVQSSILPLGHVEPFRLFLTIVVIEVVLALAFLLARDTRRATLAALGHVELAHQRIRQRDALLHEVHADLDRVVDAVRIGRYTGLDLGPYLARQVIGRGGGGEVYEAIRRDSGDLVAVKVMPQDLLDDRDAVKRFFREIEICRSLESPHIVRILESGQAPDGAPYFAMELLQGKDLASLLRESPRLVLSEVLELVSQVSRALAVAHEAGIVHRDLKPQNLHCTDLNGSPLWKVLDFGVSKVTGGSTLAPGAMIGTPSYMAPEQITGAADLDHRADVFSLGVIAYRTLTGRPPFTGKTFAETVHNVQHVQPARPSALVPIPSDVDLVLALALSKHAARRPRSVVAFSEMLADAARSELSLGLRQAARDVLRARPWWAPEVTLRARRNALNPSP